jgi:molybdopterin synthase sulfur carrier subunit
MKVSVRLYATLRRHRPGLGLGEAFAVELPEGTTVGQLVASLGLPKEEVKVTFVNGLAQQADHPLVDGDQVGIFPPVGGG